MATTGRPINSPVEHLQLLPEKRGEVNVFLVYEKGGAVQKLIHQFKYYGNRGLAWQSGRLAALELNCFGDVDLLLPVPLYRMRKWRRGYNQSEWIAKGMASVLGKPVNTNCLKRKRKAATQTRKTIYERWLNVENIFESENEESLKGKHILLVDDVITTGATISSCIRVLGDIQGIRISVFALSAV